MIVGDSLQEEMFFSFLSALRATFLMDSNLDRANYSTMYVLYICMCILVLFMNESKFFVF